MTSGSAPNELSASRSSNGQASVLVGIATHNRADLLRKAIGSALDQIYRQLRVAVIDDGSTDSTPALREKFAALWWRRWDPAQGHIKARNCMMLTANEDFYVSLDDDAWFLDGDEIATAVQHFEQHPKTAAIAFDILSPDKPDRKPGRSARCTAAFIGCGHMLRVSVVKQLGGYSEFPGIYGCEEMDLCLRILDAGHDIVELGGVHVWHEKTLLARDRAHQRRSGVCNDLAVAWRRAPLAILVPAIVWKALRHLIFALKTDGVVACLQGIFDFARASPRLWRGRAAVRMGSIARSQALSRVRTS